MKKDIILDRINLLKSVQEWSKTNQTLTIGQRICLSQERAAQMRCLDYLNENPKAAVVPKYELPRHLEEKVQHLFGVMQNSGAKLVKTDWR